jgi:hypothetical protein
MAGLAPQAGGAVNSALNLTAASDAGRMIASGMIGGLFSVASGGHFASGFLAAGVGALGGPVDLGSTVANGLEASELGGYASVLGGGKFANGAITGAFAYASECTIASTTVSQDQLTTADESEKRPDLEAIANDPTVNAAIDQAWKESFLPDGSKIERGFWIRQDSLSDALTTQTFPTVSATNHQMKIDSNYPSDTVAWFHTHPNGAGYKQGPSTDDQNAAKQFNLPGIIRSRAGMFYFGPSLPSNYHAINPGNGSGL